MTKSNYETRAKKFIQQIYPYIQNCYERNDYYRAIRLFNVTYNRKVTVCHGLTRIALVTSDYVIKFDFGYCENISRFGGCESECQMYTKAEHDGYSYLLAKIIRFDYMGSPWYIMPRVYGIGRREDDANEYVTEEENEWLVENICDLHNGNYGWKNGHPIIIDYACNCGV